MNATVKVLLAESGETFPIRPCQFGTSHKGAWFLRIEGGRITHMAPLAEWQVSTAMGMVGNVVLGSAAKLDTPVAFDPTAWRVLASA